ncbi:MAG: hypothetical protein L6Q47_12275 [Ignavibacteriaceae bacterium]|nr:hypothetical protein [Ignavibacteriaceae bacterium]
MRLLLPDNIYFRALVSVLPQEKGITAGFLPSASIISAITTGEADVAFLPSLYLTNDESLRISSKIGLSFEGLGSTSYLVLHEVPEEGRPDISITGDHSAQEALLAKMLMNELYTIEPKFHIKAPEDALHDKNIILAGDLAFISGKYREALSFAEEVVEMGDLPYLNFVFCAKDSGKGKQAEKIILEAVDKFYDALEGEELFGLDPESRQFVRENMQNTILDIDEADLEGLNNLLRMLFYEGLADDIRELKFFE